MGNQGDKQARRSRSTGTTELVHLYIKNSDCIQENYFETSQCCWFQFNSMKKRKIIWQKNFIINCHEVKDQFKWASPMIELVRVSVKPKGAFYQEISDLKNQIIMIAEESERDILISPSEVEHFKSNLKRSVLLSSSQANKYYYHETPHKIPSTMGSIPYRPTKIQFQRFSDSNTWRKSSTSSHHNNKKIQRNPSIGSRSGLRKSIMSFVDDTISSVVGAQRQISKQMASHLQVFLKFTMIIEKHFNHPDCMFYHLKRKFIDFIVHTYSDSKATSQKMAQFVDSINQFMIIIRQALFDYYNLNMFGEGEMFYNPFIVNEENILSLVRTIFFKEKVFYDTVFNATIQFNHVREEKFNQIYKFLENSSPQNFYVKDKFCLNERTIDSADKKDINCDESVQSQASFVHDIEPYRQCKLILNQLEKSMTPINKMKIIHSCSEMMNKDIQKFYDVNGLEREKWVLDADQVLSIFCFIIVTAKIEHLHSHIFIVDNFSTSSQMISIFGYYLSVMNCAIEQLQSDYLDKLHDELSEL